MYTYIGLCYVYQIYYKGNKNNLTSLKHIVKQHKERKEMNVDVKSMVKMKPISTISLCAAVSMADPPTPIGGQLTVPEDAALSSNYVAAQALSTDVKMELVRYHDVANISGSKASFLYCVRFIVNGLVPSVSTSSAV